MVAGQSLDQLLLEISAGAGQELNGPERCRKLGIALGKALGHLRQREAGARLGAPLRALIGIRQPFSPLCWIGIRDLEGCFRLAFKRPDFDRIARPVGGFLRRAHLRAQDENAGRPPERLERGLEAALLQCHLAKADERFGDIRVILAKAPLADRQRPREGIFRLDKTAKIAERLPQHIEAFADRGMILAALDDLDAQGLLENLDRILVLTQGDERAREIAKRPADRLIIGTERFLPDCDRAAKTRRRVRRLVFLQEHIRQPDQGTGNVRIIWPELCFQQCERTFRQGLGFFWLAILVQQIGEPREAFGKRRLEARARRFLDHDGAAENFFDLRLPPEPVEDEGKQIQGICDFWIDGPWAFGLKRSFADGDCFANWLFRIEIAAIAARGIGNAKQAVGDQRIGWLQKLPAEGERILVRLSGIGEFALLLERRCKQRQRPRGGQQTLGRRRIPAARLHHVRKLARAALQLLELLLYKQLL